MAVIIVGIGGVTNGGKTTLAQSLCEKLKQQECPVALVHQDDYFKEEEDVEYDEKGGFGKWDEMNAFNMDKMVADITQAVKNLSCQANSKTPVLIIEGILIFNHEKLNSLFDLRYVITLEKEETRRRRLRRTYDPPDTPTIFEGHVWPMHVNYLRLLREEKVQFSELDGTTLQVKLLNRVYSDTVELLKRVDVEGSNTC